MIKNFICSQTQFFFKKCFYRYGECSFDRPAKFYCSITRNDPKKVNERCKFSWKIFSSKCSYGEVESSLKAPPIFFRQPADFSRSIFKKEWFVSFLKDFHPEVSFETENPNLTTPLLFLRELVKKLAQCPKMKKNLEIKLFFVKMLPWTPRMQFQHPRRKTRHEAENFLLNVWKWWKDSFVF